MGKQIRNAYAESAQHRKNAGPMIHKNPKNLKKDIQDQIDEYYEDFSDEDYFNTEGSAPYSKSNSTTSV